METSGSNNEVIKLLPPLIMDEAGLKTGFNVLIESIDWCLQHQPTGQKTLISADNSV
ncbi:hypothetical protein IQ243_07335 [Nostocales cyanobacterium LEGE 11386]|nr:hypothetical protein [Nostocales cyanobacterium LEGE 11386]